MELMKAMDTIRAIKVKKPTLMELIKVMNAKTAMKAMEATSQS